MDTPTLSVDNNGHENPSGGVTEDKEETSLHEQNITPNLELEHNDNTEKSKNTSCAGVEDEDVVLGGDEPTKEFDGNIDEDELLKDTEVDEEKRKLDVVAEEAESASKPETDNAAQFESFEEENLDTNQNISGIPPSENEEEPNTEIADKDPNIEGNTPDISSTIPSEPEAGDTSEPTSEINTCDDGIVNNSDEKSCDSSTLENETNIEIIENVTESTNKDENTDSSCAAPSEMITSVSKDSAEGIVSDPDSVLKENRNDSPNMEGSKIDNREQNEEGTKFVHVDQDNSRPDESFDTAETGGEDPFAQTVEEAMDTSENSEKATDSTKRPSSDANNEEMDVDDNSLNEVTDIGKQNDTEPVKSLETTENCTKEDKDEQSTVLDEENKNVDSTTSLSPPVVEADSSSKKSDEVEKTVQTNEVNSQLEKVQEDHMSIIPDKATKESKEISEEKVQKDSTIPNSTKNKIMKMSHKSKIRKGTSSDDSSDNENDFKIEYRSVTRPKRSAAKKAESQIKEMSAVEAELEPDDIVSNDADSNGVEDITADSSDIQMCFSCKKVGECKVNVLMYGKTNYFCDESCFSIFRDGPVLRPGEGTEIVPPSSVIKEIKSADFQPIDRAGFERKCSQCSGVVKNEDEKTLSWETMDFCSEECLGKYQQELGSHCANCKGSVQPASLGKYCVRFGYEVKQFCCSSCLEEFKKGLKVCSFCQKDISSGAEGFLAPVGDKGTFKDFCTQACMEKYEQMSSNQPPPPQMYPCHVCNTNKLVEVEVFFDSKVNKLCSDICFTAYKFANKLTVDRCDMCRKYFDKDADGEKFNIFYDEIPHNFCCKTCMNVYILAKRKIVPCNWCKVKKYNFDMIKRVLISGQVLMMCSLNCLTLYQVSVNAVSSRRIKCDMCLSIAQAQYHLTMSDATIRNFCTYPCVMNFQQQYSKSPITLPGSDAPPIPTGAPKRVIQKNDIGLGTPVPVISSVSSLANGQPTTPSNTLPKASSGKLNLLTPLLEPVVCRNKNTQTRPAMNTKSVSCRPHTCHVETQTDDDKGKPLMIPIPVPIYVPCPMSMYSLPFPVPIPFPLPIPVPVFLPTTRNSIKGIMKEIKRIQEKVPADPFEAELLMMAEMVAEDKKDVATSSDSDNDNEPDNEPAASDTRPNSDEEGELSSEAAIETNNTMPAFGEDIMQIALKMATELDEPAVDLESQLTPATILNKTQSENNEGEEASAKKSTSGENRGRKRLNTKSPVKRSGSCDTKKRKKSDNATVIPTNPPAPVEEPKPDANMKLKFTFGVNAWKSWVTQKNIEIEKLSSTNKKIKPFKTDILQLTTDELNFSLCLFVKEVKKPNGTDYAPDTIYYLCLGIQQYLFENGRIDNIFTDNYFESFTDSLDEVAKKFSELFNDHHYIVTRVEEEHLWESKQLGAHSPHVLLSTLMFFNTKHFNLTNVDEHMMLSFSHIMKHWKRNPNQQTPSAGGKAPGSRNVLLRFYPPQSVLDDPNNKKKKVYEQHENEENPLRCPVKLYEFYLSKCPESVRSRSDVFYLQPERSCVPDSPVWYSTMALSREPLEKLLNRVKMVKEINIALLTP